MAANTGLCWTCNTVHDMSQACPDDLAELRATADLLARVRAGSEVRGPYGDGVTNAKFIVIESTDAELLRDLAEVLRRE